MPQSQRDLRFPMVRIRVRYAIQAARRIRREQWEECHGQLVLASPERLVWGGDWPHPRVEGEMPDAGHLLELFQQWTPDEATQQRILVANPARLYGFPN